MRDFIGTLRDGWKTRNVSARKRLWDGEYASGFGNQLKLPEEQAHNLTLVDFMVSAKKNETILDVSCGEGLLLDSLAPWGYPKYLGFDFSGVALMNASKRANSKASFVHGLAEFFDPDGQFDSIIFKQCLYHLEDPLQVIRRYQRYLAPDAAMLVSLYTKTDRVKLLAADISKIFRIRRSVSVSNGKGTWNCSMLAAASPAKLLQRRR
jgi:2-polyprenyl-3-methyl-5-hydroxy-6-metoxy-1,4-benzoquinol methylase